MQLKVAAVASNLNVPPLALKTGVPEIVKNCAKFNVPLGAVKVPPEMIKEPLMSEPEGKDSDPELIVVLALEVNVV